MKNKNLTSLCLGMLFCTSVVLFGCKKDEEDNNSQNQGVSTDTSSTSKTSVTGEELALDGIDGEYEAVVNNTVRNAEEIVSVDGEEFFTVNHSSSRLDTSENAQELEKLDNLGAEELEGFSSGRISENGKKPAIGWKLVAKDREPVNTLEYYFLKEDGSYDYVDMTKNIVTQGVWYINDEMSKLGLDVGTENQKIWDILMVSRRKCLLMVKGSELMFNIYTDKRIGEPDPNAPQEDFLTKQIWRTDTIGINEGLNKPKVDQVNIRIYPTQSNPSSVTIKRQFFTLQSIRIPNPQNGTPNRFIQVDYNFVEKRQSGDQFEMVYLKGTFGQEPIEVHKSNLVMKQDSLSYINDKFATIGREFKFSADGHFVFKDPGSNVGFDGYWSRNVSELALYYKDNTGKYVDHYYEISKRGNSLMLKNKFDSENRAGDKRVFQILGPKR